MPGYSKNAFYIGVLNGPVSLTNPCLSQSLVCTLHAYLARPELARMPPRAKPGLVLSPVRQCVTEHSHQSCPPVCNRAQPSPFVHPLSAADFSPSG